MTIRRLAVLLLLLVLPRPASAQVSTRITSGGTLPTTCSVGGIFEKTGSSSGLYICLTTNTWSGPINPVTLPLSVANGGTNLTAASDDNVMVGNGTTWQSKALTDCDDSGGNHLNYDTTTNAFSCGTSGGGGSSALSSISAASTSNTIASGNNHSQIWNWALTSNSVTAFTFGETTAATSGTADNQVIVGVNTLASSTATALYLKNYGASNGLRIDDVSGDTSPFLVGPSGAVSINTTSNTGFLNVSGDSYFTVTNGTFSITNATSPIGAGVGIGTTTNVPIAFFTNNSTDEQFALSPSGYNSFMRGTAPTTVTRANSHVLIGGSENATNSYRLIGFGYNTTSLTNMPAYIGFKEILNTGNTYGDLLFYTRSVTTDTAPTERLRIVNDGGVLVDSLKTTGSAGSKNVVCVDTSTGKLFASSTGTDCSN